MDLGVDEEAGPALGYYDVFADLGLQGLQRRDDEAPPVWGYRGPSCWSRCWWHMMRDDLSLRAQAVEAACIVMVMFVIAAGTYFYASSLERMSFSVGLAGYGGIDPASPGRVASPAFDVTLRMTKACVDRADVVVAYAGVALGWARAEPRDCAEKRWATDVEVAARGRGVGLPMHLRDRMASEWRAAGKTELDIDVMIFGNGTRVPRAAGDDFPDKVMTFKVRLDAQRSLPFAWYDLDPVRVAMG